MRFCWSGCVLWRLRFSLSKVTFTRRVNFDRFYFSPAPCFFFPNNFPNFPSFSPSFSSISAVTTIIFTSNPTLSLRLRRGSPPAGHLRLWHALSDISVVSPQHVFPEPSPHALSFQSARINHPRSAVADLKTVTPSDTRLQKFTGEAFEIFFLFSVSVLLPPLPSRFSVRVSVESQISVWSFDSSLLSHITVFLFHRPRSLLISDYVYTQLRQRRPGYFLHHVQDSR